MPGKGSNLILYHAETAVCAAKVRVTLAEKGLDYEGRMINLQKGDQFAPDYVKLNPNAVVPTLIHEGNVLIESTTINEYLDDAFPQPSLMPANALGRAQVHGWTKKEDTIHDAINTMTACIVFRHDLLQKSPEERAERYNKMPDPAKREKWRRMMDEGLDSAIVDEALGRFAKHFQSMDKALADQPWLAGENFTLADVGLLSFFYRLEMLQCLGLWSDHFVRVSDWYERARQRPSFNAAIVDFISPAAHESYARIAGPLWPKVNESWKRALAAQGSA